MALWDRVTNFLALNPMQEPALQTRTLAEGSLTDLALRAFGVTGSPWRTPSIKEALGVPAIQRAVSLIASTTGMLSVQGYRSGGLMPEAPRLIMRPDPFHTPGEFYAGTAYSLASRGEFVWWIASRDSDGMASALIRVPLAELVVEENTRNRLFPKYTWQNVSGTRFSAANPAGDFVHVMYPLAEPFALRGQGPLQLCGAATSVTVEAQEWAANFYAEGGHASDVIKHAGYLDATLKDEFGNPDPDGMSEAARLRAQWIARDANTPAVIDQAIESITAGTIDQAGAQMLDARQHQNGDAARMFGVPGSLMEYQQPGSSLTYQNLEGEFTKFVKVCLQPIYLEPIEQALSDLMPRSTVARFNVKGFLRADAKTRAEIYQILVPLGVLSVEQAQQEEGIVAGDVEFAPVPYSPPTAIPSAVPQLTRSEMRDVRCPKCQRLITRSNGDAEGYCKHCKHKFFSAGEAAEVRAAQPEVHVHLPEGMVRVETPVTIQPAQIHVDAPIIPAAAPMTVALTQPDTEARIAGLGADLAGFTTQLRDLAASQATAHEENQASLSELAESNRDVARKLGESLKPRKISTIRDPATHQITGMTTEAA